MNEALPKLGAPPKSAEPETENAVKPSLPAPEHLACAKFAPPSTISLAFVDGLRRGLAIDLLEMPTDQFDWSTVAASSTGESMTVKAANGETIPIDSATLRYLVDEKYAAIIDQSIRNLHISPADFDQAAAIAHDPRWHEVGDEDDLL